MTMGALIVNSFTASVWEVLLHILCLWGVALRNVNYEKRQASEVDSNKAA